MNTAKGKIKAIPVKEVTEGMQVLYENKICKVINRSGTSIVAMVDSYGKMYCNPFTEFLVNDLVVEYDQPSGGQECVLGLVPESDSIKKQLSLKYSQWQAAIDNGEVDSDKVVEFEIVNGHTIKKDGSLDFGKDYDIAKIIIQQQKLYTEEELREAMKYASSHLSSMRGINQYIENLKK